MRSARRLVGSLARAIRGGRSRTKRDVLTEYGFLFGEPVGESPDLSALDPRSVNWVMPPISKNSGGHLNALRFAYMLEQRGFHCRIVVPGGEWFGTPEQIRQNIQEWYFPIVGPVFTALESVPPANYSIATGWETAYAVRRLRSTRHRCYFVQDFEPWFNPAGTKHALCEATYRFGFHGITAGTWLEEKLAAEYGMRTASVGFSYDRSVYRLKPRRSSARRVLFYGKPSSARRAFELGFLALHRVASRHPDVEVVFVGGSLDEYVIPFRHRCEGLLDFRELADLYNECDLALVLSMTNLSLLPLELMACGVPVVSNRAPWTQWLLSDEYAQLCEPTVESIADGLCGLLENPRRLADLREVGFVAAERTSWDAEGDKFAAVLRGME